MNNPAPKPTVRILRLRPARNARMYDLHRAALEWSLVEPIILHDIQDVKSFSHWSDKVEPYEHQMQNLFTFCRRLPVMLIADDVGLGKTISAGLVLSELMTRRRVKRALVLCPSILLPQWVEELDVKFGIPAVAATGEKLDHLLRASAEPIVVTTYDSARSRLPNLGSESFDMIVLDEAHKVRNLHGTDNPPLRAQVIREALEKRLFRYALMLTATPIQNRLWDIYSLVDCLTVARGHRNPFGSPEDFRIRFIQDGTAARRLVRGREEEFRSILRQYLVRTRRNDARLPFPERQVVTRRVKPTARERDLFPIVRSIVDGLNALTQTSVLQALVSSPEALAAQLENMARNGTVPATLAQQVRAIADRPGSSAKMEGLRLIVEELRRERPADWRLLVFTTRKETQQAIARWLVANGITCGLIEGGDARGRQRAIEGFREDPPRFHVVVSTDSGAEGVNLQSGNVVMNFDLPWNPMIVEQRIGRIQRLGSKHEHVMVLNLVLAGTFEEHIVAVLIEKLQVIAHTIGDIEALLEATDMEGEDGKSLEAQIRDMVLQSLRGRDMRAAAEQAAQSIERAREMLESQREELDQTLGRLDDLHRSGPTTPKLERIEPSMPADEFVRETYLALGARVENLGDGTWRIRQPGKAPKRITFDEAVRQREEQAGVFMGNAPDLFLPGRREFERLTQHWCENYGAHVRALSLGSDGVNAAAAAWCSTIEGAAIESASEGARTGSFVGQVLVKAKVVNGVDSYETLIPLGIGQPDGAAAERLPVLAHEVFPADVVPELEPGVQRCVEENRGVRMFFDHYRARFAEEAARAQGDPQREKRLREDLEPSAFAEVVGMDGVRRDRSCIAVRFRIDGEGPYEAGIEVDGASRRTVAEPERAGCEASRRSVPVGCLETSPVSRKRVLRHLLVAECAFTKTRVLPNEVLQSEVSGRPFRKDQELRSAVSGMLGHRSEFLRCARSGDTILPAESAASDVSKAVVRRDLLRPSDKSGRLGLNDELVTCALSGLRILRDEAALSAVSGCWMDRDLADRSEVSSAFARPDELVRCEESQVLALPAELGACSVSGKKVDRRLLAKSAVSGREALQRYMEVCVDSGKCALPEELRVCSLTQKRVLPDVLARSAVSGREARRRFMERCAETGNWALPDELQTCAVTGKRVLPSELETCCVTRARAIRSRMARSDLSGRWVLREHAVTSARSAKSCVRDEAVICQWSGTPCYPDDMEDCLFTGLRVKRAFLDDEHRVLKSLVTLFRSQKHGLEDRALAEALRSSGDPRFRGLTSIRMERSPDGSRIAYCGHISRFLGFKTRFVLFVAERATVNNTIGRMVSCSTDGQGGLKDVQVV